jgi:hypothetical protein
MQIKVVSSHFNEDLSWTSRIKYPVVVYSKTINNSNYISFNKVQEAPAYLRFIIENYNNLPDYTFFVHGHEYSIHQTDSIVNLINNCELTKDIVNINRPDWYNKLNEFTVPEWNWIKNHWEELFRGYFNFPSKLWFPACAQFAVRKNLLLSNSLEFYKHCYFWCQNTNLDNYISSRIFEYMWFYIFTGKEVYE